MTAGRSAELLGGVGSFTVVGEGQAAATASEILRTLGGSVRRVAEPIGSIGVGSLDEPSVVICDLVERWV